jgi:hypothetical protein
LNSGDLVVMGNRSSLRTGQEVRPKLIDLAPQSTH